MMPMAKEPTSARQSKGPELLQEMTAVMTSAFEKVGKAKEQAVADANTAIEALIWQLGGQLIYFPFGAACNKAVRDRRIWEEFNGNNVREIAQRHKVSMQFVYRVIREQREKNRT